MKARKIMHSSIVAVLVVAICSPLALAQTNPIFNEDLELLQEHLGLLDLGGNVPEADLQKMDHLLLYLAGVIQDGASTPLVRSKMINVIRCGFWEIYLRNVFNLDSADDGIFAWMSMIINEIEFKAIALDIIRIFLPPLPPPPPEPMPACTVEILVSGDEGYAPPPDSGVRFDSFADVTFMRAVARDENMNEIDGTFTWSVTPELGRFGHSVTPRENDSPYAQTTIDINTAIESIRAGIRGFFTQYKVHVDFTDGTRMCSDWMDVSVRIREPPPS